MWLLKSSLHMQKDRNLQEEVLESNKVELISIKSCHQRIIYFFDYPLHFAFVDQFVIHAMVSKDLYNLLHANRLLSKEIPVKSRFPLDSFVRCILIEKESEQVLVLLLYNS